MIVYKLLEDGAFVAGDTETKHTNYAYPESDRAMEAKKSPLRAASSMMEFNNALSDPYGLFAEYDARNWARLSA